MDGRGVRKFILERRTCLSEQIKDLSLSLSFISGRGPKDVAELAHREGHPLELGTGPWD